MVDAPVNDVQVNGTSIVENGVANVPIGTENKVGVVQGWSGGGTQILQDGRIGIFSATKEDMRTATHSYHPVTPIRQHVAVFYGLAKVAGHDEKDSTLPAGTYTEEAKTAIRTMLGLQDVYEDYSSALSALGVI